MTVLFGEREIHLRDYLYVLRKRRWIVLFFLIAVVLAALLFTVFEDVLYRATATILIERENPNILDFKEVMAFDASTTDFYQTQYQMLESRNLIDRLIEKENLTEDPYLLGLQKGRIRNFLKNLKFWPPWLERFLERPPLADVFIRQALRVDPLRNTRLVRVSILHPDPARSAKLANRLVNLFIERNLENRFIVSERATQLIAQQLVGLKDQVTVAEEKLQRYKEEHNLVAIPSIREKDEFIQEAKLELVKLQAEESKLAKRYLPEHPEMIRIRSQIEGLQEKIEEEGSKKLKLGRVGLEYAQLERETESARRIYSALLSRLQETLSEAKAQASNILLVDEALAPQRPDQPRPFLNFLVGLFLGGLGGVLLAFFFEYLDSTVKIPEDIEKGLGLELFGVIPEEEPVRGGLGEGMLFFEPGRVSAASEAFRALRTSLLFRFRHLEPGRVVLVTSPNPEEGKSMVALNLAAAFQHVHLRVLLIDGDLRKGRVHEILGVPSDGGLTGLLEGEISESSAIQRNVAGFGFDFVGCGARSDRPTEILGSPKMKAFLDSVKETYDLVLVDSSPYLPVADVAVLSEYANALVVVARYHRTDRRHLKNLKRRFAQPDHAILGVVINRVSVRERDYYYHQYYYYGYGDVPAKK